MPPRDILQLVSLNVTYVFVLSLCYVVLSLGFQSLLHNVLNEILTKYQKVLRIAATK